MNGFWQVWAKMVDEFVGFVVSKVCGVFGIK